MKSLYIINNQRKGPKTGLVPDLNIGCVSIIYKKYRYLIPCKAGIRTLHYIPFPIASLMDISISFVAILYNRCVLTCNMNFHPNQFCSKTSSDSVLALY